MLCMLGEGDQDASTGNCQRPGERQVGWDAEELAGPSEM